MRLPPKPTKKPSRSRTDGLGIQWRDYPLIQSREYPAYCRSAKRYRDPQYKRWTCLLRWDVLTDDLLTVIATIPMWIPLGCKETPRASRRGNYLKEWVRANGGPPVRSDRLSSRVFTRRMARVEVGDTDPKKSPVPYSVVRRIVSWETGGISGHSVSKSHSQGRQRLKAKRQRFPESDWQICELRPEPGSRVVTNSSSHPRGGRSVRGSPVKGKSEKT